MTAGKSRPGHIAGGHTGPTVRSYRSFVRRHRVLIIGMALVGASVGGWLVVQSPAVYIAQTKVAVTPAPTGADVDVNRPRLVSLDSDALLLTSGDVLTEAVASTGFPGGVAGLSRSIDVSAVPNSRVLVLRVSDADRSIALRACEALVTVFLQTRADTEQDRALAAAAELSTQITDVLERLADLRASDATAGVSTDGTTVLDRAAQELLAQLGELQDDLRRVTLAGTAVPGTVVAAPAAPVAGARPMAAATVASGLLLGTLAGLLLAGVRAGRP